MSRFENTSKNLIFSFIGDIVYSLLGFVNRTVFIQYLGAAYLGTSGLFTNILSMLSLTELGVSSAIAFNLYKPLAEKDTEAIKSLMLFYKKAYRIIACVILVLGLSLIPFLDVIIKDPGDVENIPLIYLVFLYNSVVSYLFSYKTTLLSADQKSYLTTNLNIVCSVATSVIQLVIIVVFKNYFVYLFTGAVISTIQWAFVSAFITRRYPYLLERTVQPLSKEKTKQIGIKIRAMLVHKIGDLCINQTDNIIISSFISIVAVGLYNNYYMIINIVNRFVSAIFNAAKASLGNLIAVESCEKQYEVFKRYNFLGFWVYGWTGICLYVLLNPFVDIWLGEDFLISKATVGLVVLNYYLTGMRTTLGNMKIAAGIYEQDQWVPLAQAAINLIISVIGAKYWGLAGVFLGTVVSSIVPCWYRPVVVYKYLFHKTVLEYFMCYFQYVLVIAISLGAVLLIDIGVIAKQEINTYIQFVLRMVNCVVVPNLIIVACYCKSDEFLYVLSVGKRLLNVFMKRR